MSDKQQHWVHDVEGVYALVEGADQRDQWTKVRGWTEAGEPGPTDQVHVVNENPQIAQGHPLPYGALEGWAGLGFRAGPPPEPYGTTKPAPPVESAKTTKTPAVAGGEKKEQ